MSRRGPATAACGLALALGAAAPTAIAAPSLRVSPARPTLATPIAVSSRAAQAGLYGVTITVRPASRARLACSYGERSKPRRVARGGAFTALLKPSGDQPETRRWCPGPANITVLRYPGGEGPETVIVRRRITIRQGPRDLPPGPTRTPAALRLLAGSTVTLESPGHPARSAPVNGVLRGYIPSPFRLNEDITIKDLQGSLVPVGLAADPLCPGTSPPFSLRVTPSTIALSKTGRVTMTLTLAGSPSQLSGCGPAGALTAATTMPLNGQTGPRGLLALDLDGAAAGITLHLLVLVDLRSRA